MNSLPENGPMVTRLLGHSPVMQRLRLRIKQLGPCEESTLVLGETGTGKELCARALHDASLRAKGPFIALNCGAVESGLLTAELFGSRLGAFTGAIDRRGLVSAAAGGTLFLDEIGDLPLSAQAVLLRVLETRRVRAVGSDADAAIDFRVISATHQPLAERVEKGLFRADLFHRISTLELTVPPLRNRIEDIPALAAGLAGAAAARLSPAAWTRLSIHRWPGNVRELRNVLRRADAEARGAIISRRDLHFQSIPRGGRTAVWNGQTLRKHLVMCVEAAYQGHGRNARAAALALDISPTTLYRYLSMSGA